MDYVVERRMLKLELIHIAFFPLFIFSKKNIIYSTPYKNPKEVFHPTIAIIAAVEEKLNLQAIVYKAKNTILFFSDHN